MNKNIIISFAIIAIAMLSQLPAKAQIFRDDYSQEEKEYLVHKIKKIFKEQTGQISGFYLGKANDATLFFNYCSTMPMQFENGREKLDYSEENVWNIDPNGTYESAYKRYQNPSGKPEWSKTKIAFDEQGRVKQIQKIIESRSSLDKKKGKLKFSFNKINCTISYPDANTMIIKNAVMDDKKKKNTRDKIIIEEDLKIQVENNIITNTKTSTSYYKNGPSKSEEKYVSTIDDSGRILETKLYKKGEISDILSSCTYNDKDWLSTYETKHYKKGGEKYEYHECEITYELNESDPNPNEKSSYTAINNDDWYDETGELIRQQKGLKVRIRQDNGTMGPWKNLSY